MPVHITPSSISRRRFVSSLLTVASGALAVAAAKTVPSLHAVEPGDEGREAWALLSDTHIAADPQFNARGINMAEHLRQSVEEDGGVCEKNKAILYV